MHSEALRLRVHLRSGTLREELIVTMMLQAEAGLPGKDRFAKDFL